MIPPISSTQGEIIESQNMVGWKSPFNMRQVTLMNLAASQMGTKNGNKSNVPYYKKAYSVTSSSKSLELLRQNLQNAINRDFENVIKKYLERFFKPAIVNIKNNLGKDAVNEEHLKEVCRRMLDEAKSMYKSNSSRESSPYECSDSEASLQEGRIGRNSPFSGKRKESEIDTESHKSNKKIKIKSNQDYISYKLPIKREAPKWDSDRINSNTLFIMGAKANKVLGFGQTRGRLYVRHPELVRYSGDQEDKEWLSSKNLMPPSGGKAYLMILNDIKELTESDDYKNSPNLQLNELRGFEVPSFLVNKVRNFMESVRTDKMKITTVGMDLFDSLTTSNLVLDSPLGESGKHSNFVHIPETSPSSNHSILSSSLNQSPSGSHNMSPSPNMLLAVSNGASGCSESPVLLLKNSSQNGGTTLSSILAQHFGTDTNDNF